MEVAVAGALVAILSACVFRGILTVKHNSQALAQRIAAQGVCMHRYEEMKAVAWENVLDETFPATNVLLCSLSKDPTKGRLMATVSNMVSGVDEPPLRKHVDIFCTWTFRGRERTEILRGEIVNGYSTYAKFGPLSGTIDLNPNYNRPQMFYVRTTEGTVYTQANIETLPSSFSATTLVVMPGGGGRQSISLDGATQTIANGKTVAFIASELSDPIVVSISKTTSTIPSEIDGGEPTTITSYSAAISCGNVSFSYR